MVGIQLAIYDNSGLNRIKGRDSDFFVLHQRYIFYHLTSPIEVKKTYTKLVDPNKKHIDLDKVFSKAIIQNGVFEGRYRTTDLRLELSPEAPISMNEFVGREYWN